MKTATNNLNNNLNKRRMYYTNNKGKQYRYGYDFNCWGATMFVLGAIKKLEWTHVYKMEKWLQDKTAHVSSRKREAGDVLVMRGYRLEHTAVYIGNNKFFHKKGANRSEITTLKGVKRTYPLDDIEYRRVIV